MECQDGRCEVNITNFKMSGRPISIYIKYKDFHAIYDKMDNLNLNDIYTLDQLICTYLCKEPKYSKLNQLYEIAEELEFKINPRVQSIISSTKTTLKHSFYTLLFFLSENDFRIDGEEIEFIDYFDDNHPKHFDYGNLQYIHWI